ncbi:MAG: hypothetical protein ACI4S4_00480, partial [Candidatus Ornithospirochaeta sp.]
MRSNRILYVIFFALGLVPLSLTLLLKHSFDFFSIVLPFLMVMIMMSADARKEGKTKKSAFLYMASIVLVALASGAASL